MAHPPPDPSHPPGRARLDQPPSRSVGGAEQAAGQAAQRPAGTHRHRTAPGVLATGLAGLTLVVWLFVAHHPGARAPAAVHLLLAVAAVLLLATVVTIAAQTRRLARQLTHADPETLDAESPDSQEPHR